MYKLNEKFILLEDNEEPNNTQQDNIVDQSPKETAAAINQDALKDFQEMGNSYKHFRKIIVDIINTTINLAGSNNSSPVVEKDLAKWFNKILEHYQTFVKSFGGGEVNIQALFDLFDILGLENSWYSKLFDSQTGIKRTSNLLGSLSAFKKGATFNPEIEVAGKGVVRITFSFADQGFFRARTWLTDLIEQAINATAKALFSATDANIFTLTTGEKTGSRNAEHTWKTKMQKIEGAQITNRKNRIAVQSELQKIFKKSGLWKTAIKDIFEKQPFRGTPGLEVTKITATGQNYDIAINWNIGVRPFESGIEVSSAEFEALGGSLSESQKAENKAEVKEDVETPAFDTTENSTTSKELLDNSISEKIIDAINKNNEKNVDYIMEYAENYLTPAETTNSEIKQESLSEELVKDNIYRLPNISSNFRCLSSYITYEQKLPTEFYLSIEESGSLPKILLITNGKKEIVETLPDGLEVVGIEVSLQNIETRQTNIYIGYKENLPARLLDSFEEDSNSAEELNRRQLNLVSGLNLDNWFIKSL